ncbi:hypothetical protein D3C77_588270 [compost metagenome]
MRANASTAWISAGTSALGRPRYPSSKGQVFRRCKAASTASSVKAAPSSGSSSKVVSRTSSATTPPMPSSTAVPTVS